MRKLWIVILAALALALSQGPNLSTHAFDGGGSTAWTNPTNAQAEDGVFATVVDGVDDATLNSDTYGFSIPGTATITGLKIEVKIKTTLSSTAAFNLGTLTVPGVAAITPTTILTWLGIGADGNMLGTTQTPSSINASAFGMGLGFNMDGSSGVVSIDAFRITVFYTIPSGHKFRVIGYGNGQTQTQELTGE